MDEEMGERADPLQRLAPIFLVPAESLSPAVGFAFALLALRGLVARTLQKKSETRHQTISVAHRVGK